MASMICSISEFPSETSFLSTVDNRNHMVMKSIDLIYMEIDGTRSRGKRYHHIS